MHVDSVSQRTSTAIFCHGEKLQKSDLQLERFKSSLASADSPSFIWRSLILIKDKIARFFRSIFFCCFPKSEEKKQTIEYLRSTNSDNAQELKYTVLLGNFSTDSEIKCKKKGKSLYILEITFPDQKMHSHLRPLLEHMMQKEKVDSVTTEYLDRARLLWKAGLTTNDSIVFNPDANDLSNKKIKAIIEKMQEKRGSLNQHALEALKRIEKIMQPHEQWLEKLVESFVDIGASCHLVEPRPDGFILPLVDLLDLLEAVDVGTVRGIRLEGCGQGSLVKFRLPER